MNIIVRNLTTGFRYYGMGLSEQEVERLFATIVKGRDGLADQLVFEVDTRFRPAWAVQEAARFAWQREDA